MNKIIRFYNQNRGIFWIIILGIIAVIALIQSLNSYYKNKKSSGIENTTTYNAIQTPAIAGEKISQKATTEAIKIIDDFINYCNSGEVEKAYELLSNDCKEQEYPNLEKFKNNYFNAIFDEKRLYSIQSWITNNNRITYRVIITEDILATGKTQDLNIEDYYTIVKEDNQYKLNIHNYVGKEVVNKSKTENNITFNVVEKYIYMEYEIYKINVNNLSNNKIMIDSKEKTRNVNIVDQNELKYVAFLNEISENNLIIHAGINKDLNIKFNKSYNPKYMDKYMEFSDIVLDMENKNNRGEVKIEL